ncbi:MAG: hypothetical protein U9R49_14370 [Bacteroidota bacterium]|nr:hypothetical protein [Bacteroidota bacterium]
MRNTIKGIALSLLVMLILTACEKENSVLLTDGIWTFQNLTTDSEDENIINLIALGKALLTDATMEFQEGGSYIMTSPLVEDPTTGEWQLVGEDQLIIDPDDEATSTANIETLSKDKLSYLETFVDAQMNTYTITTTWTR